MKLDDLLRELNRLKTLDLVPKNLEILNEEFESIRDVYLAFDGVKYLGIVLSSLQQKAMPGKKKRR